MGKELLFNYVLGCPLPEERCRISPGPNELLWQSKLGEATRACTFTTCLRNTLSGMNWKVNRITETKQTACQCNALTSEMEHTKAPILTSHTHTHTQVYAKWQLQWRAQCIMPCAEWPDGLGELKILFTYLLVVTQVNLNFKCIIFSKCKNSTSVGTLNETHSSPLFWLLLVLAKSWYSCSLLRMSRTSQKVRGGRAPLICL